MDKGYYNRSEEKSSKDMKNDIGWSCPTCTFYNTNGSFLTCEICGEVKPSSAAVTVPNDDDDEDEELRGQKLWEEYEEKEEQRRVREREEQVERERMELINIRMQEIVLMQEKLWTEREVEKHFQQETGLLQQREALRMQEEQLREQQARIERQRIELDLQMQQKQLKEQQARLQRQREELELHQASYNNTSTRPGVTTIPAAASFVSLSPGSVVYELGSISPQRKLDRLQREPSTLEQQQQQMQRNINDANLANTIYFSPSFDRQNQPIARIPSSGISVTSSPSSLSFGCLSNSSLTLPGAVSCSPSFEQPNHAAERKLGILEQERRQLEQQLQGKNTPSPGAVSISPYREAASAQADRKLERLDKERKPLANSSLTLPGAVSCSRASEDPAERKREILEQERRQLEQQLQQVKLPGAVSVSPYREAASAQADRKLERLDKERKPSASVVNSTMTLPGAVSVSPSFDQPNHPADRKRELLEQERRQLEQQVLVKSPGAVSVSPYREAASAQADRKLERLEKERKVLEEQRQQQLIEQQQRQLHPFRLQQVLEQHEMLEDDYKLVRPLSNVQRQPRPGPFASSSGSPRELQEYANLRTNESDAPAYRQMQDQARMQHGGDASAFRPSRGSPPQMQTDPYQQMQSISASFSSSGSAREQLFAETRPTQLEASQPLPIREQLSGGMTLDFPNTTFSANATREEQRAQVRVLLEAQRKTQQQFSHEPSNVVSTKVPPPTVKRTVLATKVPPLTIKSSSSNLESTQVHTTTNADNHIPTTITLDDPSLFVSSLTIVPQENTIMERNTADLQQQHLLAGQVEGNNSSFMNNHFSSQRPPSPRHYEESAPPVVPMSTHSAPNIPLPMTRPPNSESSSLQKVVLKRSSTSPGARASLVDSNRLYLPTQVATGNGNPPNPRLNNNVMNRSRNQTEPSNSQAFMAGGPDDSSGDLMLPTHAPGSMSNAPPSNARAPYSEAFLDRWTKSPVPPSLEPPPPQPKGRLGSIGNLFGRKKNHKSSISVGSEGDMPATVPSSRSFEVTPTAHGETVSGQYRTTSSIQINPMEHHPHTGESEGRIIFKQKLGSSCRHMLSSDSLHRSASNSPSTRQRHSASNSPSTLQRQAAVRKDMLHASVADITIAGMDHLMDDDNPLWEKSIKKGGR